MAKSKRITAKQKSARRRNIKVAQSARKKGGAKSKAKDAFKKEYKAVRKSGGSKEHAMKLGLSSAMKASPRHGGRMTKNVGYALAKTRGKMTRSTHRKQFAAGFTRSIKVWL